MSMILFTGCLQVPSFMEELVWSIHDHVMFDWPDPAAFVTVLQVKSFHHHHQMAQFNKLFII